MPCAAVSAAGILGVVRCFQNPTPRTGLGGRCKGVSDQSSPLKKVISKMNRLVSIDFGHAANLGLNSAKTICGNALKIGVSANSVSLARARGAGCAAATSSSYMLFSRPGSATENFQPIQHQQPGLALRIAPKQARNDALGGEWRKLLGKVRDRLCLLYFPCC